MQIGVCDFYMHVKPHAIGEFYLNRTYTGNL